MCSNEPTDHHDTRVSGSAIITEILGPRTYRAQLPIGKVILAFYPRQRVGRTLAVGERVQVAISLYDFSEGEIVQTPPLCSDERSGKHET